VSGHDGLGQETGPSKGRLGGSAQTGPSEKLTFRVKPGFQFFYTLPVLLALAILVDALFAPAADKWLFLLLVLILAAISVPRGWSKVTLDDDRLTLHMPLRRSRAVDLRHLSATETSPRLGQALVLRYHPVDEHNRPDLHSEAILGLPPLQDQAILEEHLRNNYGTSH
jgi:hypothetical protein